LPHDWFAKAVPGSRLEVLEGQGHNAQFSAPDVLAEEVNAFLET
jgi:pimeloyl-ACP methyl ester carboxylesterase